MLLEPEPEPHVSSWLTSCFSLALQFSSFSCSGNCPQNACDSSRKKNDSTCQCSFFALALLFAGPFTCLRSSEPFLYLKRGHLAPVRRSIHVKPSSEFCGVRGPARADANGWFR